MATNPDDEEKEKEKKRKRLLGIFRRLGSPHDNEILIAVKKLKQAAAAEGLSINDLSISIGNDTSEKKYSDADAETIFKRGKEVGRTERQKKKQEFFDINGEPRWFEITSFNRDHIEQLKNGFEEEFTQDIVSKVLGRPPTEKQARVILKIFIKLGGECHPKARAYYFEDPT
jgi:hypothetical protein